ncbi:MAG: hydrogenase maturation peptidase HycI [Hadesarchaea archaeon]|nr:hydrogenase maturation peptidase HycI [Hadesarchaea archaeon]
MLDLRSVVQGSERVAIIGVGSDMRGDDAAGVEVARRLRQRVRSPRVVVLEAGVAPENFTSRIKKFRPSLVIIVDTADFGGRPGETILAQAKAITGLSVSTHAMPLSFFAEYLGEETNAKVVFLGVQPKRVDFGARMSREVKKAIGKLVDALAESLQSF